MTMDIEILQPKGKPAQVIIDINLFFSIVTPDKLKEIKKYKQLVKIYNEQINNTISEDVNDYSTFEDWNKALCKIDKRNPDEFSHEYGMTIQEFRKQIWDAEKNISNLISYQDFKQKWKKRKIAK